MTWLGGRLRGPGRTVIAPGAELDFAGDVTSNDKDLGGGHTLRNEGAARWTGIRSIWSVENESATFQNAGAFDLSKGSAFNDVGGSGERVFTNDGLVEQTQPDATSSIKWRFNNRGVVEVDGGALNLDGGGVHTGSFTVASGSALRFRKGKHRIELGAHLDGEGTFAVWEAILELATDVRVTGVFELGHANDAGGALPEDWGLTGSGTLRIESTMTWFRGPMFGPGATVIAPGATLNLSHFGGKFIANLGKWEIADDLSVTGALALHTAAALTGSATLTIHGTMDWHGGWIEGPGQTVIADGATLNIVRDWSFKEHHLAGGHTRRNEGTINWTHGTVETEHGGSATIWNQGRFNMECSGTLVFSNRFTQFAGATRVAGGALTFVQPVELQGGVLGGSGTITANVTNTRGTLAPGASPGLLNLVGDYVQSASGSLQVEIGGPTPGDQFDQLQVTGTATLDGALRLSTYGGYSPASADAFPIMTFGSRHGTFANVTGWDLGVGVQP